ncbi:MAG: leucyl aminopeptidase [Gammaproteobacteria bacterium]|nr:leucyl aminopeptidase [Gammaproteobacteria bacterium]MDH5735003.1 leucyl aminopeptidase [Gammaproteobacteria bacterium]
MEFSVKSGSPEKQRISCVAVGVFESRKLSHSAQLLDEASDGYIANLIRRGECEGKLGQTLLLHNVPNTLCDRVLLIGCGREKNFDTGPFQKTNNIVAKFLDERGATEVFSCLTELNVKNRDIAWKVNQAVQATEDALYTFDQLKSKKESARRPLRKVIFSVPSRRELPDGEQAVRHGMAIASGITLAKDLANLPGNICTPSYLAEQAKALGKTYRDLKVNVLEESDMEALKMGSLLSVARGSRQPAKLITLEYNGAADNQKPIIFVGKGVTFDSGGISLKPGAGMDEMKFDMCGAASVIGIMSTCAELQLPINVVGIIPATENLPDGLATKPGDIVTSMSGTTIEILNTDAEGRLILCDALTYAAKYDPHVVIDIATLTGACIIALGNHPSGLLGNHNPLINELLNAGKISGDRCWELPLWDDYQQQLDSNFADIANIGGKEAGTITAACFLSRFTKKYHWAHLDIAGTAWRSGKEKGATGRPVPLLAQYLLNHIADQKL